MRHIHNRYAPIVLLLSLILLAGSGCKREEQHLFDKSPLDRALDLAEECEKTLLAQPYGWQMEYKVPNEDIGGSFILQLKFGENKSVEIWSDFLDEPTRSSYRLSLINGPTLTFDTPGALTMLANPALIPGAYRGAAKEKNGYYGENDFLIISVAKEQVQLRGLKYGEGGGAADITLTPLREPASISNRGIVALYNRGTWNLKRFGSKRGLYDGEKKICAVTFDCPEIEPIFSASQPLPKVTLQLLNSKKKVTSEYEVTFTDEGSGFTLTPALEYEGQSYSHFTLDAKRKGFFPKEAGSLWINLQATSPA